MLERGSEEANRKELKMSSVLYLFVHRYILEEFRFVIGMIIRRWYGRRQVVTEYGSGNLQLCRGSLLCCKIKSVVRGNLCSVPL